MKYNTKEKVLARAQEAKSVLFKDIDVTNRLTTGKGGIGTMMEENWFELKPNSKPEPDFLEAGVELKVTPFKQNKNGTYSAKERLVLNIINYIEESEKVFDNSSFWLKNSLIQMMFYEHNPNIPKNQWYIKEVLLYDYPEEDKKIIMDDWNKIVSYINNGKAHELSEGLTDILGACTKGANAKSLRKQPYNDTLAMQRAFSFKSSYMTRLVRQYVFGEEKSESIIKDFSELKDNSFEEAIINKLSLYKNETTDNLLKKFNLIDQKHNKDINNMLVSKMLGLEGKVQNSEEFLKMDIEVKTVRIESNNSIKESMSFVNFKFKELLKETWETSSMREYFETKRFMFVIFKFDENNTLRFNGIKFWNMPVNDLDIDFKKMWEETRNIIRNGVIIEEHKSGRKYNNLPKSKDSSIGHVRPHAAKASYEKGNPNADELPDGRWMTKQSFWLNNHYILSQIHRDYQFFLSHS